MKYVHIEIFFMFLIYVLNCALLVEDLFTQLHILYFAFGITYWFKVNLCNSSLDLIILCCTFQIRITYWLKNFYAISHCVSFLCCKF